MNPNPGDYFTTPEKFDRAHKALQIKAIRAVLCRMCNPDMDAWREDEFVMRALSNAGRLLRGSNLAVDSILPALKIDFDGYFDGLGWQESMAGLRSELEENVPSLEVLRRAFYRIDALVDDEDIRNQWGRNGGCELVGGDKNGRKRQANNPANT